MSNPHEMLFTLEFNALEASILGLAAQTEVDVAARRLYIRSIQQASAEMRRQVRDRAMTWAQAAEEARTIRQTILEDIRWRSSPIGRAAAQALKTASPDLNTLIARKAQQLFGPGVDFPSLTQAQQNRVYEAIVESAGRSNPGVNRNLLVRSRVARGLIFVSLSISIYTIYTAEDRMAAAQDEAIYAGAGVMGSMAGGALAGLACGPGAPVCVTIGAFVGGAAAVFGISWFM